MGSRRFTATLADGGRGRWLISVPFDPDVEWGTKPRHPIAGTIGGCPVRGTVETDDGRPKFTVGTAWIRGTSFTLGQQVEVEIAPEGPQRDDLAPDVAEALGQSREAASFFDGLAQFYRRGYVRWIDATKRRPELRQERIATMVRLLEAGVKDYRDQQPSG